MCCSVKTYVLQFNAVFGLYQLQSLKLHPTMHCSAKYYVLQWAAVLCYSTL